MPISKRPINPPTENTGKVHNDVPPHLKDKVAELATHQAEVKKYSKLLRIAEKKRDQLEKELAGYLSATAPIQTCPPEVLSIAFRFYLQENPRLSRRLMLVCRKWYNTVINDPTLWTQISVHVNPEKHNVREQAQSQRSYITACIRRSGSCLLDIKVSLEGLQTTTSQAVKKIHKSMLELFDGRSGSKHLVEDWINNIDFDDFDIMAKTTASDPQHIVSLVKLIIGDKCIHVPRWRSLDLSLPSSDEELAFEIWQLFKGKTPNLEVLDLHGVGPVYDKYAKHFHCGFSNLSAIQELEVGEVANLDFLTALQPITLKSMIIITDLGKSGSYELNRFRNITYLLVMCPHLSNLPWDLEHPIPTTNLTLPHLKNLTLAGCFMAIDSVKFDLPALETLSFMSSGTNPTVIKHKLPHVNPSTIHWNFKDKEAASRVLFRTLLIAVLTRYKQAETLFIDASAYGAFRSISRDLHRRGKWPKNWKWIQAGDDVVWEAEDDSSCSDSDWTGTDSSE